MGYGYYTLSDGREAGYGVEATCDKDGCEEQIDRGLGYLCGGLPDGWRDESEAGCGNYFCDAHHTPSTHGCPNPYDQQDHPFVGDPTELDECGHIERVLHLGDRDVPVRCGVPAKWHEDYETA